MSAERDCSINGVYDSTIKNNVPLNVLFELTYRCNLRCGHCYNADSGEKELSYYEVKDIVEQLAAENCLFLTFTGGEALVREDFLDIARCARRMGFALKLFTNGSLIDEGIARELAGLKPVHVGISIYGADAAVHDRLTGVPGSFHRSLHALRILHDYGVLTMLKCLLMKENIAQLDAIMFLAAEVGAILQLDPVVNPKNDGNRGPLQHEVNEAALYRLFSNEKDWPKKPKDSLAQPSRSLLCRAGIDTCSISPGGEVYPCVALPVPLGNLREQSFAKVWHGARAREMRKFRLSDLQQCVSCPDLDYCTRCWGLAAVESGNHLGPSYLNCRIARIRHRISEERGANNSQREEVVNHEATI